MQLLNIDNDYILIGTLKEGFAPSIAASHYTYQLKHNNGEYKDISWAGFVSEEIDDTISYILDAVQSDPLYNSLPLTEQGRILNTLELYLRRNNSIDDFVTDIDAKESLDFLFPITDNFAFGLYLKDNDSLSMVLSHVSEVIENDNVNELLLNSDAIAHRLTVLVKHGVISLNELKETAERLITKAITEEYTTLNVENELEHAMACIDSYFEYLGVHLLVPVMGKIGVVIGRKPGSNSVDLRIVSIDEEEAYLVIDDYPFWFKGLEDHEVIDIDDNVILEFCAIIHRAVEAKPIDGIESRTLIKRVREILDFYKEEYKARNTHL